MDSRSRVVDTLLRTLSTTLVRPPPSFHRFPSNQGSASCRHPDDGSGTTSLGHVRLIGSSLFVRAAVLMAITRHFRCAAGSTSASEQVSHGGRRQPRDEILVAFCCSIFFFVAVADMSKPSSLSPFPFGPPAIRPASPPMALFISDTARLSHTRSHAWRRMCFCPFQPILEQQVIKSQGEVDDMYEPITPDDLVRQEWTEKAKCPDDVMATLLPYQAEG